MNGRLRTAALCLVLLLLPLAGAVPASAAGKPAVTLSSARAATGAAVTVSGSGWRPRTLLMLLICGRASPARGLTGGTNSCANADGRAVTTDGEGRFTRALPVAAPPDPCPCVVHVATATGAKAQVDVVFQVAGHPVEPLPAESSAAGRLAVLTTPRLDGSGGLLTWFGAPPARTLVLTVGNLGTTTVKDPVFRVGTAHGVFAPQWDEQQWRGTIPPGGKARVKLPVELSAGAHGDYTVSLKYGGKALAEQPWGVGRPWGVTLFWILLCLVVPAAVFRIGMAVVDRVRPRTRHGRRTPRQRKPAPDGYGHQDPSPVPASTSAILPWFTPDTAPAVPDTARPAPAPVPAVPASAPVTADAAPAVPASAPVTADAAPGAPDPARPAPDTARPAPVVPDTARSTPDSAPAVPDSTPVNGDTAPALPDPVPPAADRLSAPHDDHPTSPRLPAGREPSE